jgi:hypothetical protein
MDYKHHFEPYAATLQVTGHVVQGDAEEVHREDVGDDSGACEPQHK